MAFSSSKTAEGSLGGLRVLIFSTNFASATSGTVITGLQNVLFAVHTNEVTEDYGLLKKNSDGSSTVYGSVNVSGVTSNDTGSLLVVGN